MNGWTATRNQEKQGAVCLQSRKQFTLSCLDYNIIP